MKTGIHPKYNEKITATCSCGATFVFGSTADEIKTEVCSACHPFYTGKQKLVDTAGKVDRFRAKMAKAQTAKKDDDDKKGKKSTISDAKKAAAAAKAGVRSSAVDSARAVKKVKDVVTKRELAKAKIQEDKKTEKESKKDEAKKDEVKEAKNTEVKAVEEKKTEEAEKKAE